MEITRRGFLKLGLFSTAGFTLSEYLSKETLAKVLAANEPPLPRHGPERWMATACSLCPTHCGMLVRVVDGRACGIQGHPQHPISRGTLCPKGFATLQEQYHPDRLTSPLRRVGLKGQGQFESILWPEALDSLAQQIAEALLRGEPSRIAIVTTRSSTLHHAIACRFAKACGARYGELSWPFSEAPMDAFRRMHASPYASYDLARTNYVMSFGADWLQAFSSPIEAQRAAATLKQGRPTHRVKIVQVEARFSVTAAKADEWIPIRPGTEGTLALGVAHVLLREGLYDRTFVEASLEGFEDFRDLVSERFSPKVVAEMTDVPEATVVRLARELSAERPALVITNRRRLMDQWAIHALNGLLGSVNVPGGIVLQEHIALGALLPDVPTQPLREIQDVEGVPEQILQASASPYDVLLIVGANPVFTSPQPDRWKQALSRVPYVASLAAWRDDTAQWADVVLPAMQGLETWQAASGSTLSGERLVTLGAPILRPQTERFDVGECFMQVAQRIGGALARALPWKESSEALEDILQALFAQEGRLLDGTRPTSFEAFALQAVASGGWVERHKSQGVPLNTDSSKVVLSPPDELSAWEKPAPPEEQPPGLWLYLFSPLVVSEAYGAHLPFLLDVLDGQLGEGWGTWCELNPKTAGRLGIANGQVVRLESEQGRIEVKARLFEGARPDTVNVPLGLGHTAAGRWANGLGSNPAKLVGAEREPGTGRMLWRLTRVTVRRV